MHYQRWKTHGDPLMKLPGGPPPAPIADRFWAKVDRRDPTECWPWTGTFGPTGYGVLWIKERNVQATHVALFLHTGKWPKMFACHRCDNPPCVNPAHLFEGTHTDNARDMATKGRWNNQHVVKTYCVHGHPLSGENIHVDKHGTRHCRECARRRNREWEARRRSH